MNKKLSKILTCGVCLSMAAIFTAGCTPGGSSAGSGEDPEERPFVVAIGATDGVFSPFFATAQYDTQVTELTQISMLNADANGNIVYGESEPTVVLDYKETMYTKSGSVTLDGDMDGSTVYEFVIKNGIKFSDGVPLTIEDVLFNLYVYLDPVYFGSSTIYSTDIKGLAAYRVQDPDADSTSDNSQFFKDLADSRIYCITDYLENEHNTTERTPEEILADIEILKGLFKEELLSDWTSNYGTLSSYEEKYRFTTNWEIFYFTEGLVSILTDKSGANWSEKTDEQGRYLTDLDEGRTDLRDHMLATLSDEEKIAEKMTEYDCDRAQAIEYLERDTAIDTVFESKTGVESAILSIFQEGWASVNSLREQFVREEMTAYYKQLKEENGGLIVPTIEGIKAITPAESNSFQGKYSGHDILQITINGVDPKAIWNFAFQVAPAHYYSGEFEGFDYRKINISDEPDEVNGIPANQFGVCYGDNNFFNGVLKDTQKNKLPVGAGAYKASTASGGDATSGDQFHPSNKISYYVRNDYFETVGEQISNARIKYFRYREVEEAQLVQVLKTGDVDYGEPNCTAKNISALSGSNVKLAHKEPMSAGYGYVGINAKDIPDIEVRRAIISAMDVSRSVSYYGNKYASTLYRPMSKANWLHDKYLKDLGPYYAYEREGKNIQDELKKNEWDFSGGVGKKDGRTLKYTFTIAGGSTDHPAYGMFIKAKEILDAAGFDITVQTSTEALQKLATGELTVWAAAYTSPIDPDLYQLYHKDSRASSVKNWGYDAILNDSKGLYGEEQVILDDLSELIMKGRQTIAQSSRGPEYVKALNKIMELAVQLPTYQRNDLVVYNSGLLKASSLNTKPGAYAGVLNRVWEVTYS